MRSSAAWVMQMATFRASGQVSSNPAPMVTGIGPSSGPASGGTGVTIMGTGFQSGATVSLGGTAANNVVVGSGTSITATTPAHAAGSVNVVVTNSDAQGDTLSNGYSYIASPDFTITGSALSPATVVAGGSATSTMTITPLNGFDGTLSLSCSSIVPAATPPPTCAFASSSVTGSGTSTLTLRTTAATQGSLARSRGVFYAMWLPVGGLLVLGAGLASRRQRFLCFLLECVLFSGLALLAACGGGSSSFVGVSGSGSAGTPAGVYTVTISALGSVTHTTAVTLTVR
jgi:IPT/TIG domain